MRDETETAVASPTVDAPALTYGVARPRPWWRRWSVIALIVLLPVAGWVFFNRNDLSARVERAYWSGRCAQYVIPPETTLIVTDPARIAELSARESDYIFNSRDGKVVSAVFWPRCLREYARVDSRPYQLRGAMNIGVVMKGAASHAPITFLHERTSPRGKRFLVIVSGYWTNARDLEKYTDSIALPMPALTDALIKPFRVQNMSQYSGALVQADLHPGIADPADASHFTIPYDAEGERHTLHGYLRDDGTIKFSKE